MSRYCFIILSLAIAACYHCEHGYPQGKVIYHQLCSNCHQDDGQGQGAWIPPITQLNHENIGPWVCIILNGKEATLDHPLASSVDSMPRFDYLSNEEMTNLVNYMNHTWEYTTSDITIAQINTWIDVCTK